VQSARIRRGSGVQFRSFNLSNKLICRGIIGPKGAPPMAKVVFTANIQRLVPCPAVEAAGATVRDVLEKVFAENPRARGYVLDDQSALRKHIAVFVDGAMIHDRVRLSDPVGAASAVYVFQALSGG
jgi:sulfur-carrier protein